MQPLDDVGSGPPVVLLHAGIADRSMWTETAAALAEAGFRAIALDLPGFGDAPPGAQMHDAVLETLDGLGLERAALVGNSFGGSVALGVPVVAPDRVTSLLLLSALAPFLEPSAELQAIWEAEEEALERGDLDAAAAAVVEAWTQPDAPADLRDLVGAMQRRAYVVQGDAEVADAPDPIDADPDPLGRLDVPALAAAGEHDRPEFIEGARRLADAIPGARHVMIEGAGHLAPLETPERFRALVLELVGSPV